VKTPDPDMNRMLNIHNPRQCTITMNWSRYLSLYQLGFGARGIGFRDSSQDVMGAMLGSPGASKDLLRKLLHVQKRNGSAMHQFNPLTMIATTGEAGLEEGSPDYYSDDHLWCVLAVAEYLKETGDFTHFLRNLFRSMIKTRMMNRLKLERCGSISSGRSSLPVTIPGSMDCLCWALRIGTIPSTCLRGRIPVHRPPVWLGAQRNDRVVPSSG
jgi:hypothetical protein